MSKIAIIGEFTTKPGAFDEFYGLMLKHAAASRDEPGCLRFDVVVPFKSENRLLIYEMYEDQAALDGHAGTERIKAHREKTKDIVETRVLNICELRDSGDA
jgi:quinol monooxygenase YgiN